MVRNVNTKQELLVHRTLLKRFYLRENYFIMSKDIILKERSQKTSIFEFTN